MEISDRTSDPSPVWGLLPVDSGGDHSESLKQERDENLDVTEV
jgi:hypothetical protein